MKLNFEIVEVDCITESQKQQLFHLMQHHYENVFWDDFINDLSEKNWVILLTSPEDKIVGFSTQMLLMPDENSAFANCVVLFSGDTIIDHDYWGSVTLPVAFLKLVSKIGKMYPNRHIYWMLISKGLRTYKYLSVFLSEYYPCYQIKTPEFMNDLMVYFGSKKFGSNYIPERGIIKAREVSQYLKNTYQPDEKKSNPVADFFYKSNPGYTKGDELLCMAEMDDNNLHPFIKRVVKSYGL